MFEEPTKPTLTPPEPIKPPEPRKVPSELRGEPIKPPEPVKPPEIPLAPRKEPEDIFAPTEGGVKAPLMPGAVTPPEVEKEIEKELFEPRRRSIIKPIIIGIVVIALIGGGYFAYSKFGKQLFKKAAPTEGVGEPAQSPSGIEAGKEVPVVTPPQPTVIDTDKDGLTDQEERGLGTDPNSPDSDQDGLPDAAEVRVYNTNPLSADSDGDGYSDSQEVIAGYDPNDARPGAKLRDLQTEIDKLKD